MNRTHFIGLLMLMMVAGGPLWAQGNLGKVVVNTGTVSQTEMTLLVNAGTLGSQATQTVKANSWQDNTPTVGGGKVSGTVNTGPTHIGGKPGKYSIGFNALVVQQMYKKHVLDHLDNLIEAASINLNPGNNKEILDAVVYHVIESAKVWGKSQKLYDENTHPNEDPHKVHQTLASHIHNSLVNVNLKNLVDGGNPVEALAPIFLEAAMKQSATYGHYYVVAFAAENNGMLAAIQASLKLAYLYSYDNVAKQNDPIYKALFDTYAARNKGSQTGIYQFMANRHGMPVSFTRYGVQFGAIVPFIILSKSNKATSYLWDSKCNCPDSELYSVWSSVMTKSTFTTP